MKFEGHRREFRAGGLFLLLQTKPHLRSKYGEIARPGSPVVLTHEVKIQGEVLIESMVGSYRESVPHPIMHTPIVKNFVRNIAGKLRFVDGERALNLGAHTIAPGVNLRLAPTSLEPVTLNEAEFPNRKSHRRSQCQTVFSFMPQVWWIGFAVKVKRIKAQILVCLEHPTGSPALISQHGNVP